jgi:hypothetical protein
MILPSAAPTTLTGFSSNPFPIYSNPRTGYKR